MTEIARSGATGRPGRAARAGRVDDGARSRGLPARPWARDAVVLGVQAALLALLASRHEFWRDEIRALTIVTDCPHFLGLFRAVHNEGHPLLWYVLLYASVKAVGVHWALQVTGGLVALGSSLVFLRFSPFRFWQRALFAFGHYPIYEYAVVSRNHGTAMLVLLVMAVSYSRRFERPVWYGSLLALLANTSGFALPVALAALAALAWDVVMARPGAWRRTEGRAVLSIFALALLGIAFSLVTTYPDRTSIVTGLHGMSPQDVLRAALHFLVNPGKVFGESLGTTFAPVCIAALWLVLGSIASQSSLLVWFLVGSLGTSVMFELVYRSTAARHHGVFMAFAFALLWLAEERRRGASERPSWAPRLRTFVVSALLIDQVAVGAVAAARDFVLPMSSCPALGRFLASDPRLARAVVLGEPDYTLEALPYYARNDIYIPREGRFGKRASFTTASRPRMSLDELLQAARDVRRARDVPVVIAIGKQLDVSPHAPLEQRYSYNKVLVVPPGSAEAFARAVVKLATFDGAENKENFDVFEVR